MKLMITGASGQLGTELLNQIELINKEGKFDIIKPSRTDLDLTDSEKCRNYVKKCSPEALINLAAYTSVDKAEEYK